MSVASAAKAALLIAAAVAALAGLAGAIAVGSIARRGVSARDEPTWMETSLVRRLRKLAIPRGARELKNPVPLTAVALQRARAHFADHCASCHDNDGRGKTELGQSLYPKPPDMWLEDTQSLSDGELFSIIENGIRLTGMPALGSTDACRADESWELVHFIRHLPKLTPEELEEMEQLNPRSRREWEEDEAVRKFLAGEGDIPVPKETHH